MPQPPIDRRRRFARWKAVAAVVLACGGLSPASAQDAEDLTPKAVVDRPTVRVPKLFDGETISVDARLDEPAWKRAVRIGDLTQTVPIEGAPMTKQTDVYLTYDADTVYVGVFCHDDPAEVRARQMDRDAFVRYDDVVEMWFDPFASERFAYWFQVTPGGSLGDALIADNGASFNKDWDGIWYGDVQVTDDGWVAELAIPVKTLSFDPEAPYWGFNIVRKRVANGEDGRWASPRIAYQFFQISEGGRLTGIDGLRQGVGLDVTPYVKYLADRESSERSFGSEWDAGVDLRWRPTPASTVLVTTNTDFAETEVDTRQVNIGRFPLFFPERRDFFLEDAGAFEFGLPSNRRRLLPFFSRTIGRDEEGGVVPILAGLKVTGRFGDWTVGALDTYVGEVDERPPSPGDDGREGVDRQNLGVVRLQRSLGDGRSVGVIGTSGDPAGDSGRFTAGADLRLGSTRLFGEGHSGFLWSYVLGTGGGETDETSGLAYGIEAQSRSTNWETEVRAQRTEEGFDPALGFVRRTGVDRYQLGTEYTWRSEDETTLFRQIESGVTAVAEQDLIRNEDAWSVPVDLAEFQFWSQDAVSFRVTRRAETIDDAFSVGDATVFPGDYDETRYRVRFESNDRRLFGLEAFLEVGDYYGGEIRRARLEPAYIPNRFLAFALSFEDVDIDLDGPGGSFHTQLYSYRVDVNFDPFTSWNTFVQYGTEDKNMSVQSRIRWIIEPGRELFVVGLFGFDKEDHRSSFTTEDQSLAVKLEYTFRF